MTKFFLSILFISLSLQASDWTNHAGPNNNYKVSSSTKTPNSWSVALNKNIRWKVKLPETSSGNVIVVGNRLFLTCFKKLTSSNLQPDKSFKSSEIVAYCYDARNGKKLWSAPISGKTLMGVNGLFNDATTPTPISDGKHVWFINASGTMACFTVSGKKVWEREFEVRQKHAAKMFQPFVQNGLISYAMMRDSDDPKRRQMSADPKKKNNTKGWPWVYVRAFDTLTGQDKGILDDGISVHCLAGRGQINGEEALIYGRGWFHNPPEKPNGLTAVKLNPFGEVIWRQPKLPMEGIHSFDERYIYTLSKTQLMLLDPKTGKVQKTFPLNKASDYYAYDSKSRKYSLKKFTLKPKSGIITHRTLIGHKNYQYFMAYQEGILGRIHIETGKVELLQVPIQVSIENGKRRYLWSDFKAYETYAEKFAGKSGKPAMNGFGHISAAIPTMANNKIYFTTVLGTVYVIDAEAKVFDKRAILGINDLGHAGKTFTLSSVTFANGKIYHRTRKELICISQ